MYAKNVIYADDVTNGVACPEASRERAGVIYARSCTRVHPRRLFLDAERCT
jgi:hypothetical protein